MESLMEFFRLMQPYGIYLIATGGILIALGFIIGFFEKPAVATIAPTATSATGSIPIYQSEEDTVARLEKLADLRKRGLITDADFEALKAKALRRNE